jgi:hypothetical protein
MRAAVGALAISMLSGCIEMPYLRRRNTTAFEPFPAQRMFRYVVSRARDPDDEAAERERVEWLEQYLRDNKFCPNGYDFSERNVVIRDRTVDNDGFALYYYGKCR